MRRVTIIATISVLAVVITGCGGSDDTATSSTTSPSSTETTDTTEASTSTTTTTEASTSTTAEPTTTSTEPVTLEQPAIWPAAEVVFSTPGDAAEDFVSNVLGVPPALGEFQQGDSRSGEIEVLSLPEGGGEGVIRSVLLMRQLGPDDGWFVIGAVSAANTIASPESMAAVAAGPVEVTGEGRGFEGTLVIEAFVAGDSELFEQQITQGGSFETPEPYSVTLDFSGQDSGTTMLVLVRGGVGLETDPGEFSAIPLVIG